MRSCARTHLPRRPLYDVRASACACAQPSLSAQLNPLMSLAGAAAARAEGARKAAGAVLFSGFDFGALHFFAGSSAYAYRCYGTSAPPDNATSPMVASQHTSFVTGLHMAMHQTAACAVRCKRAAPTVTAAPGLETAGLIL